MSNFQIPLVNSPQKFSITLNEKSYLLTCKWNSASEAGWVLDFEDATTNVQIAANIPLITGADCLEGLSYLGFDGKIFVLTDGDQFAVPTLESLGVESFVYFQTVDV